MLNYLIKLICNQIDHLASVPMSRAVFRNVPVNALYHDFESFLRGERVD